MSVKLKEVNLFYLYFKYYHVFTSDTFLYVYGAFPADKVSWIGI